MLVNTENGRCFFRTLSRDEEVGRDTYTGAYFITDFFACVSYSLVMLFDTNIKSFEVVAWLLGCLLKC